MSKANFETLPDLVRVLAARDHHRTVLMIFLSLSGLPLNQVVSMKWNQVLDNVDRRTVSLRLRQEDADRVASGWPADLCTRIAAANYIDWLDPDLRRAVSPTTFVFPTRQSEHISPRSAQREMRTVLLDTATTEPTLTFEAVRSIGRERMGPRTRGGSERTAHAWWQLVSQSRGLFNHIARGNKDDADELEQMVLQELVATGKLRRAEPDRLFLSRLATSAFRRLHDAVPIPVGSLNFTVSPDVTDRSEPADRSTSIRLVKLMLKRLGEVERKLVCLRYGLDGVRRLSMADASASLGISTAEGLRIHRRALRQLEAHARRITNKRLKQKQLLSQEG